MTTSQSIHDQNLLFGILAVQLDFVSQQQLMEAMQAWLLQKSKSVAQLLVERGVLTADRRQLLANLVREHLRQHNNDPQKSIAAIRPAEPLRDELNSLRDPQVSRVISRLPAAPPPPRLPGSAEFLHTMPHAAPRETGASRRYVIVRPLDEGGLGKVSVAMDTEVAREVALKEIKPMYADNTDSRARFLKEAEITGRLEHPGIVPVYGLGTYDDGRPYYAMRMITGCSLKDAIQEFHEKDKQPRDPGERRLALCELLQRFISVCHAIEYAHSRGIVHRDLKPANVMLGKYRETLVVDWGLAKPVGESEQTQRSYETVIVPEHGGESVPTRMGEVVGTTAFMSPEQAGGKLRELGPPSDIYSLGATLYNLITGTVSQTGGDLAQQLRNILQGKFARPREANRQTSPALESICLKAMALHPNDRYPSAKALADDVEKYLADEPTSAHRESWSERLTRWERRYRTLVRTIAAGLAMIALLGVTFAGIFQKQRNFAQEQEAIAKEQRDKAEKAEARAEKTLGLMVSILKRPDPEQDGKTVTIYEALRETAEDVSQLAEGDFETEASLNKAIGETLFGLGLAENAVPILERAREGFTQAYGADDPGTLSVIDKLGNAYSRARQPDKALPILEENLRRTRETQGPNHSDTLSAMNNLASGYQIAGQWDKSLSLLEKCYEQVRSELGAESPGTLSVMNNLASGYQAANQMAKALPLFEQTAELARKQLGADDPRTLVALRNLAVAYQAVGEFDKGLEIAEQAWELRKKRLGVDHLQTLNVQQVIQSIQWESKHYPAAESLIRDVLAKLSQPAAERGLGIAKAQAALADTLLAQGKLEEAESQARRAMDYFATSQPQAFEHYRAQSVLGRVLAERKEWAESERWQREAFRELQAQWVNLQPFQRRYTILA
ncbi:MAG TPA: serine/threonine-protein kinase, partial [Pirellulaceae bacterium]